MTAIPRHCPTAASLLLALLLPHAVFGADPAQPIEAALTDATGFVGYVDPAKIPEIAVAGWPGARARVLSEDASTGRRALLIRFRPGWTRLHDASAPQVQSIDIVMLEGTLRFGDTSLARYDFAFVPPGVSPPNLAAAGEGGARALVFFDPPASDAAAVKGQRERGVYVTPFDPERWIVGATPNLKIMYLKKDPFTTARTSYVRIEGGMAPGAAMPGAKPPGGFAPPWEVHSTAEEGVLMEGRRSLAECLPDRTVVGIYGPEGYYWRPGGIPHGGPESGPVRGSPPQVWLQRSQVVLDFAHYRGCEAGRGSDPLPTPPSLGR